MEQDIITVKGTLEKVQNEIALSEKKKREAEDEIKNIQEYAGKKNQELQRRITELTKEKDNWEELCGDLSVRYKELSDDLDEISTTLEDKKERLKKVEDELDIVRHKKARWYMSKAVWILMIFALVSLSDAVYHLNR